MKTSFFAVLAVALSAGSAIASSAQVEQRAPAVVGAPEAEAGAAEAGFVKKVKARSNPLVDYTLEEDTPVRGNGKNEKSWIQKQQDERKAEKARQAAERKAKKEREGKKSN